MSDLLNCPRHPHRHTVDHETLVMAGSQVPGLSTTFSGKRPLLHNFPSGKERKVVSCLEGKLSPTNAKDEKSRAQVVKSRDEVEDEARAPAGIPVCWSNPPVLLRTLWYKCVLSRDPAAQQFPDLYADQSSCCDVVRVKGGTVTPA